MNTNAKKTIDELTDLFVSHLAGLESSHWQKSSEGLCQEVLQDLIAQPDRFPRTLAWLRDRDESTFGLAEADAFAAIYSTERNALKIKE